MTWSLMHGSGEEGTPFISIERQLPARFPATTLAPGEADKLIAHRRS
jgi:hypothetical protein